MVNREGIPILRVNSVNISADYSLKYLSFLYQKIELDVSFKLSCQIHLFGLSLETFYANWLLRRQCA